MSVEGKIPVLGNMSDCLTTPLFLRVRLKVEGGQVVSIILEGRQAVNIDHMPGQDVAFIQTDYPS
jgi:hypothetical protein